MLVYVQEVVVARTDVASKQRLRAIVVVEGAFAASQVEEAAAELIMLRGCVAKRAAKNEVAGRSEAAYICCTQTHLLRQIRNIR